MTMELNQQTNQLVVNGYLKDKNLRHISLRNGNDAIVGSVDVAFKEGNKHNVQRLNVFAGQYTRAGKENPSYKSIAKVESDFNAGKENPDRVHVSGQINYNVFANKQGEVIKTMRKNGSFFNRISPDDDKYHDQARAHVVLTVTGYEDEITNDGATGNKLIHNLNVGYGSHVNTIPNLKFNMASLGDDIDTVVDTFPAGSTVDAQIVFRDYATVQKSTKAAHGFGHHVNMSVATKFTHEALIDYLEVEPVKGKQAMSKSQISHAKNLMKQDVENAKGRDVKHAAKKVNNALGSQNPMAPTQKGPATDISDDDVPF